jgi:ABC-type nitrate/sulfonate/bicarbonate transport system substrate-binding protein
MRKIILLLLLSCLLPSQEALQKVSLQLLWLNQFQFAGYYMAQERGYYRDAGLDVTFKPYKYSVDNEKTIF